MNEFEIALLVVLVIILILLLWRWWKSSKDKCIKECQSKCGAYKEMMASKFKPAGYSAVNPSHKLHFRTKHDGYIGMQHGPGSDSYDSYIAASESMSASPHGLTDEGLIDQEMLRNMGLNHGVLKSHKQYLTDSLKRTSGASLQSVRDDPNDVVTRIGLRQPQYHVAKTEAGARTVSSEYHTQMHPGNNLKWESSANAYDVDC
jgi:hypothetical protein